MTLPLLELEPRSGDGGEHACFPLATGARAPTAATYWRTLWHLRWSQLGYLGLRRLLPRSHSRAELKVPVGLRDLPGPRGFLEWQPEASRKMLATREFTFLNQTVTSRDTIPWNDHRFRKLWLYHLNYFDFLNVDFVLPDEDPLLQAALEIMLDWCRHNAEGTEVGWEPYALSVRIVNWLKFLVRHGRSLGCSPDRRGTSTLLKSLHRQVSTLEHRLEKDLLGNHLLKNIKAMLFAGALLKAAVSTRWGIKGEYLLEHELNEQVLPDGGHFERSPMYHLQVLEDFAEIGFLYAVTGKRLPCSDLLSQKVQSLARFLKGILHPDGEIPLFNDSVLGGGRPPAESLAMAESPDTQGAEIVSRVTLFPDTGYGVLRSPESQGTLIFDCGPLGPDYQPGHGHCDVLSYELSLHGQRVVVDTGVSTYERGPERSYERSTAAHNTVRIDGEEQAEIWGSFRVGRRPRVRQIQAGSNADFSFVSGEHDAYRRLGVVHARKIMLRSVDTWIVADLLTGSGSHLVESFLHFHPGIRVAGPSEITEAGVGLPVRSWTVEFSGQSYLLITYGHGEFEVCDSWCAEQFGKRQTSLVLRWSWHGEVPTGMVHVFIPEGNIIPSIAADWAGKSLAIDGHMIPLC